MFKQFLTDESGQDFVDYAILIGLAAAVAMAVIPATRDAIISAFNKAIAALGA
jgi:Flp pilus assembly pilin Flp